MSNSSRGLAAFSDSLRVEFNGLSFMSGFSGCSAPSVAVEPLVGRFAGLNRIHVATIANATLPSQWGDG